MNDDLLHVGNNFVRENEIRVSEDLNGVPVSDVNVYVSAASAPSMRSEDVREGVIVTQAEVHGAPQRTGAPVNRGISPINPEIEVSRAYSAPATMSLVTYCTTTTTALPFATRT